MRDERLGLPSASEFWRLDNCHGSKILSDSLRAKGIDLEVPNLYATLGDRIHSSLEGYKEDLDRRSQEIRDDCDRLSNLAAYQYVGTEDRILKEERLWYTISETPFFSARPDRVYLNRVRILNVNFKTGISEEEDAASNLQLRTELVLLHFHYPDVPEIGVAIIQPLATKQPEIAVYDRNAMETAEAEILQIVDRAAWDPKRRAGPWCKYCPARAFCPEARELATDLPLRVKIDKLPSGPKAAEFLDRLVASYKILDAIKAAFAKKVADDPKSVPGWHINAGKKVRSLPKENEEGFALAAMKSGLSENALHDALKFSIPTFEKLAEKEWGLKGWEFKRKFNEVFEEFIEIRQDAGYLEKIPKRLRQSEESV